MHSEHARYWESIVVYIQETLQGQQNAAENRIAEVKIIVITENLTCFRSTLIGTLMGPL